MVSPAAYSGTMSTDANTPKDTSLSDLRAEIDDLEAVPENELISPTPDGLKDVLPHPQPTDAIGSEDWDDSGR